MDNIMNCVVTGGAGFIGSHLCKRLLEDGNAVVAVDNLSAGKVQNIASIMSNPNFKFINMDVRLIDIENVMRGADTVFNLMASKKNVCLRSPLEDLHVNSGGTLNLLQIAQRCGVRRFIHASTGSVYGNISPQIEEGKTLPVSYYGISKLAGENYVKLFADKYTFEHWAILRYFHVYGGSQESADSLGGVIAIFLRHIYQGTPITVYGDGSQVRCFTYVKDVVSANIQAANGDSDIYNCVSDERITINELIEMLFEKTGKSVPVIYQDWQEGDIKNFFPINGKIKSRLGIRFTPFDVGIQETIDAYCSLYS